MDLVCVSAAAGRHTRGRPEAARLDSGARLRPRSSGTFCPLGAAGPQRGGSAPAPAPQPAGRSGAKGYGNNRGLPIHTVGTAGYTVLPTDPM